MLPIARQPQRPRAPSTSVLTKAKYLVTGRQSIRWILVGLGVVSILWLLLPPLYFPHLSWSHHYGPPRLVEPVDQPVYIQPPSTEERLSYSVANLTSHRSEAVRGAFLHAYNGYSKCAGTYDELLPVSGDNVNNFNGWTITRLGWTTSLVRPSAPTLVSPRQTKESG